MDGIAASDPPEPVGGGTVPDAECAFYESQADLRVHARVQPEGDHQEIDTHLPVDVFRISESMTTERIGGDVFPEAPLDVFRIAESGTPEPVGGKVVPGPESALLESQANLRSVEDRCQLLTCQLAEKDRMITTLQRSCGLMEKETALTKRELELAQREKESAVMRYAIVEKKVIDANVAKEAAEKRLRDGQKEVEAMNHKIKHMTVEKTRMSQIVDQKCSDIRHHQREMEKLKMDVSMWESTNKASTARLKQEVEARGAAEQKVAELTAELETLRSSERAQIKSDVDCERLQVLEKQAVEQQAALILHKHESMAKDSRIAEWEKRCVQVAKELKDTIDKHSTIVTEHSTMREEREGQAEEICELQRTLDKEVMKVAELQAKVNDLEAIRAQLRIERDANSDLTTRLASTKEELDESNTALEMLRRREEELLAINRELTECVACLQNEMSLHKSKAVALAVENESIGRQRHSFDTRYGDLERELQEERRGKIEATERLEKELAESKKLAEDLAQKLATAQGDTEALKSKHQQSLKELNRELMLSQKRCAKLELLRSHDSDCLSTTSHSENVSDSESIKNGCNGVGESAGRHSRKASDSSLPGVSIMEPSKQSLIDRIVRLQQANAKQMEKVDFLENHSATLVAELQKKAKLVHYYMMRDQSGALVSSKSDKHKADLAKYGGIMAAIYGGVKGSATSADMTLDLSLEINRKLQAVLEDTLLKNITLKENLDTLGLEVDKLTRRMATK